MKILNFSYYFGKNLGEKKEKKNRRTKFQKKQFFKDINLSKAKNLKYFWWKSFFEKKKSFGRHFFVCNKPEVILRQ